MIKKRESVFLTSRCRCPTDKTTLVLNTFNTYMLLTFHVPTFIDFLQLMSSLCFMAISTAGRPFGFGPVASFEPVAPDSSMCSSSVAIKSPSGLRVSPLVTIVNFLLGYIMNFLGKDKGWFAIAFPPFAVRARSFTPPYGGVTNRSPHEKVGTVDFGSPTQVGTESTPKLESSVGSPPCFTHANEWLTNLCDPLF